MVFINAAGFWAECIRKQLGEQPSMPNFTYQAMFCTSEKLLELHFDAEILVENDCNRLVTENCFRNVPPILYFTASRDAHIPSALMRTNQYIAENSSFIQCLMTERLPCNAQAEMVDAYKYQDYHECNRSAKGEGQPTAIEQRLSANALLNFPVLEQSALTLVRSHTCWSSSPSPQS